MADKVGAYGKQESASGREGKWDIAVFQERAKERDKEAYERAKEAEEAMKQGKKPPKRYKQDLPKPTQLMKQREAPLELETNLNKTMIVQNPGGRGADRPGFYCNVCNRVSKDSIAYLDHINSRSHLRRLGQTTNVERSTLDQVRARIAHLRAETREASRSKAFDFKRRLAEVQQAEDARRAEEKERRIKERAEKLEREKKEQMIGVDADMADMMGFGGFGGAKKNR